MARPYDGNLNNDYRNYSDLPEYSQKSTSSQFTPTYSQNIDPNRGQHQGYNPQHAGPAGLTHQPAIPAMTPEDMLFLQKWKNDAFVYRTMPIALAGMGSLYYYNKSRSLPNPIWKYVAIGCISWGLGFFTYRNEFQRRLIESNLNTPFAQNLRKIMKINSTRLSGSEFVSDIGSHPGLDPGFNTGGQNYSDVWEGGDFVPDSHFNESSQFSSAKSEPTKYGYPQAPSQSPFVGDSMTQEPNQKQTLSYDELRARNRGYFK